MEAAAYSSVHVHHNIARHPSFLTDPVLAIKDGIKTTDERVCAKVNGQLRSICRCVLRPVHNVTFALRCDWKSM